MIPQNTIAASIASIKNQEIAPRDVLVIDYGVGNHLSILNALDFLGYTYHVSHKKEDIRAAKAYILPGVGAFNEAMKNIEQLGFRDVLAEEVLQKKKPLLGICLGMQVLAGSSEENGYHQGLGWIKGNVVKIKSSDVKVPHVGWNDVSIRKPFPLFSKTPEKTHFYFDHSYHISCDSSIISATCSYGTEITAAIQQENIFGVQFHPEKSQNNGLRVYRSFFNYVRSRAEGNQLDKEMTNDAHNPTGSDNYNQTESDDHAEK